MLVFFSATTRALGTNHLKQQIYFLSDESEIY